MLTNNGVTKLVLALAGTKPGTCPATCEHLRWERSDICYGFKKGVLQLVESKRIRERLLGIW